MAVLNIAKITLNGYYNYGGVLQNYALQELLKRVSKGNVNTLWLSSRHFMPYVDHWGWKEYIKCAINWKNFRRQYWSYKNISWESARRTVIRKFCQKYISIKIPSRPLENLASQYDYFVTGSDQVWNPFFSSTRCREEFLTFVPSEKRIAYAASIGLDDIPQEDKANFTEWLNQMAYISVREQAGADIVKRLTGKTVPVLLDPTMVLDAKDWEKIEEQPLWFDGKPYICTYFLGERPAVISEVAKKMGGIKVINIMDPDDFDSYITTPEEFIFLIHHAELVYTDSFHGTVFSILFHRPFVICDRNEAGMCKMNSRINTLLGLFSLQSRYATAETGYQISDLHAIDFSHVDAVLKNERQRSYDYLTKALGGK